MKSPWILVILASLALTFAGSATAEEHEPSGGSDFQAMVHDSYDLGDVTITVGPRITQWEWTGAELGPAGSRFLRDLVDGIETGEKDGQVSESEAEAAERSLRVLVQGQLNRAAQDPAARKIVIMDDDVPVESVLITRATVRGVVGPVESEERIGFDVVGVLKFETRSADVHTLQVRAGTYQLNDATIARSQQFLGDFTITIQTERGWVIDPASIQPDCAAQRFDAEKSTFRFSADDLECFRERGGDLIAFTINGDGSPVDNFVPGFEAILAGLALAGAAALGRRRAA